MYIVVSRRQWTVLVLVLAGCGRIGFGATNNALGDHGDAGAGGGGGGGGGDGGTYAPVNPTLCQMGDNCSPCTTTSSQSSGSGVDDISMVSTASGWAVAWSDGAPKTYVSLFDSTGAQTGSTATASNNTGNPILAIGSSGYGLISTSGINVGELIDFTPLGATGAATGSSVQLAKGTTSQLVTPGPLAASPSGYAFVWWIWNATQQGLTFASLTSAGKVNTSTVFSLDYAAGVSALAWNGDEFGVVYYHAPDNALTDSLLHLARFDGSANMLGDTVLSSTPDLAGFSGVMATTSGEFAVAWVDDNGDVVFALYAADGTQVIAPRVIAVALSDQSSVESLIPWGSGYALAWGNTTGDTSLITELMLLDANGTPTSPLLQFGDGSSDQQFQTTLAAYGSDLAVVWWDTDTSLLVTNMVSCP
jgi:hypothetical protein